MEIDCYFPVNNQALKSFPVAVARYNVSKIPGNKRVRGKTIACFYEMKIPHAIRSGEARKLSNSAQVDNIQPVASRVTNTKQITVAIAL